MNISIFITVIVLFISLFAAEAAGGVLTQYMNMKTQILEGRGV